jgi:UDP-glucose 4-epimerase
VTGPLQNQRVLVTGGTGFVGSHVVPMLSAAGAEVTVVAPDVGWREPMRSAAEAGEVDLLPVRSWWTPAGAHRIANEAGEVDHLVHLGYQPPQGDAARRARDEIAVNTAGTLGLVAELVVHHVCFASSVKVYGRDGPSAPQQSDCAVPVDPYGAAKLATEQQLRALAEAGGPACTAIRLTTLYGPGETVPRAIPSFIRSVLAGGRPTVRGPGTELGDYLHVHDAARLLTQALERPPERHRLLDAGTGEGIATRDLARRILRLVRGTDEAEALDAVEHIPGESRPDVVCDISRTEAELGFRPSVALDEGLLGEIDWFAQRPRLWCDEATLPPARDPRPGRGGTSRTENMETATRGAP